MKTWRKFSQSFRLAWSMHRFSFVRLEDWDMQTDGMALRSFLSSSTGRKLLGRLDHKRAELMASATLENPGGSREFACGRAMGFNEYFLLFGQLSPSVQASQPDQSKQPIPGADELLEQFAP